MAKVSRTYRIEQKTADKITEIAENENMTATEVVEDAIRAYSPEKYIGNTANKVGSTDSPALAALIDPLPSLVFGFTGASIPQPVNESA